MLVLASGKIVAQQHGDRQRANATRNGRDIAGDLAHRLEVDIPDQLLVDAVDPHIDHHRSRFDHLGRNQSRATDSGDQNVSRASDRGQVATLRVTDGDGRIGILCSKADIALHEHISERFADNVAASDDDDMFARQLDLVASQKVHYAVRSTWQIPRSALYQQSNVLGGKRIDVFAGVNGIQHALRVDPGGQRKLY